jgi:hypothetical protein
MIKNILELQKAVSSNGWKWGRAGSEINRFRALRTKQKTAQDFYDLKFDFKIYEEYQKIKLPIGRDLVDTFVAHLPLTNPVVEVIPFKPTATYQKRAIDQQEFYQALLLHSLAQSDPAPLYAAKDIALRGEAFLKVVYDIGAIEGLPEQTKEMTDEDYKDRKETYLLERMPLKLVSPDPMNCYPSADHINCRPAEMIEVYEVLAGDVRRIWPEWKSTKSDSQVVVFIEYWNDDKRCFLADGKPVHGTGEFEDNPYRVTPYVHVYSGWGIRTGSSEPETRAVNIIFAAEELIKAQCRKYAYLDKALAFASMPIIEAEGRREDYETPPAPKPGSVYYREEAGQGVKVVWAAPNLPDGILQAISLDEAMLNKRQPAVLRGQVPQGTSAGYPMALMLGEARLHFGVPLENLKVLFGRALELVRYLIRNVGVDDLMLWGKSQAVTLKQADCEGAYQIKVDFDATTPESRGNRALVGQRLRQGGSISQYTELKEWQNNENPEKEITRINAESILKHPAIQQHIAVEAVRELKGEQAALMVEQIMAGGQAGAERKAESTGIPVGGITESEVPEDVLAQAIGRRQQALGAQGYAKR